MSPMQDPEIIILDKTSGRYNLRRGSSLMVQVYLVPDSSDPENSQIDILRESRAVLRRPLPGLPISWYFSTFKENLHGGPVSICLPIWAQLGHQFTNLQGQKFWSTPYSSVLYQGGKYFSTPRVLFHTQGHASHPAVSNFPTLANATNTPALSLWTPLLKGGMGGLAGRIQVYPCVCCIHVVFNIYISKPIIYFCIVCILYSQKNNINCSFPIYFIFRQCCLQF